MASTTLPRFVSWLLLIFIVLVTGVTAYGTWHNDLPQQVAWSPGLINDAWLFGLVAVVLLLVWRYAAISLAVRISVLFTFLYLFLTLGFVQLAVTVYCFLSLASLGALILGRRGPFSDGALEWVHFLVGAAVAGMLLNPLLSLPIHTAEMYAGLGLLPIALRWRGIVAAMSSWHSQYRSIQPPPSRWPLLPWVILAVWFCFQVRGIALPSVGADDGAYHLALPAQLLEHHRALFNIEANFWALAPWMADLIYAIPMVISGIDCRGGINLLAAIGIFHFLWEYLDSLALRPSSRWLTLLGTISLPMLFAMMPMMQNEMLFALSATVLLALLSRLHDAPEEGEQAYLAVVWICGLLLAMKTTTAFLVLPVFLLASWLRHQRHERYAGWRRYLTFLGAAVVAGTGYVTAYWISGNPVMPLFNGIFKTPYFFPVDFFNARYMGMMKWSLLYDMQFHSQRFYESLDGVLGLQYLFFLPAAIILFPWLDKKERWRFAVCVLICLLFVVPTLLAQQYIRYIVPVMFVLSAASMAMVLKAGETAPIWLRAGLTFSAVLAIGCNTYFAPNANWLLGEGVSGVLSAQERKHFLTRYAPEYELTQLAKSLSSAEAQILYDPSRPYGALAAGREQYVAAPGHWVARRLRDATSQAQLLTLLRDQGIVWFIKWDETHKGAYQEFPGYRLLLDLLPDYATPTLKSGRATLYRLNYAKLGDTANILPTASFETGLAGWFHIGSPKVNNSQVSVNDRDYLFHPFPVFGLSTLVFRGKINCEPESSGLLLQMNWYGPGYLPPEQQLLPCGRTDGEQVTRFAVPSNAEKGELYLQAQPGSRVNIATASLLPQ